MRIRTHTNPLSYTQRFEKIKSSEIFSKYSDTIVLEIGFGQSSFLLNYAKAHPQTLAIGVEARKKAVEAMQETVEAQKAACPNVHLVHGNGYLCLQDMFDDHSLNEMFIFHPDPWIKRRHQKRRLMSQEFLDVATHKLTHNGLIHISTDVAPLWQEIMDMFARNPQFVLRENHPFWIDYTTSWHEMCQKQQRQTFCATFSLIQK